MFEVDEDVKSLANDVLKGCRVVKNLAVTGGVLAVAKGSSEGADYLPNIEGISNFEPHVWVKNAILMAYISGLVRGAKNPLEAPDAYQVKEFGLMAYVGTDIQKLIAEVANG